MPSYSPASSVQGGYASSGYSSASNGSGQSGSSYSGGSSSYYSPSGNNINNTGHTAFSSDPRPDYGRSSYGSSRR
ncbi:hypothetical protein PWT90_04553 [Aphanocladium album]|nr:hypothetical protein PWT90_04553 [Aphanocladium album]